MKYRIGTILLGALLCMTPTVSHADLTPYSQDFETLVPAEFDQPAQTSLANDGWRGFVNVFSPDGAIYFYGYGFPAPNGGFGGPAISAVVTGEGGPDQGAQQLTVFSDYNNGNHADGFQIETNVFQEQIIGAADVGTTWRFTWDAKKGDIEPGTLALAWFKTLDPNAGFALTRFIVEDMSNTPDAWGTYSVDIAITPDLVGQILQIGFLSKTTLYRGSGIFYDNINFDVAPIAADLDFKPGGCGNPINARSNGRTPIALLGSADFDVNDVDTSTLSIMGLTPEQIDYEDVATPAGGEQCECTTAGADGLGDLSLKFDTQDLIDAIGDQDSGSIYTLTLTGSLLDGTAFEATDCIVFVGGGNGARLDVYEQPRSREGRNDRTGVSIRQKPQ